MEEGSTIERESEQSKRDAEREGMIRVKRRQSGKEGWTGITGSLTGGRGAEAGREVFSNFRQHL